MRSEYSLRWTFEKQNQEALTSSMDRRRNKTFAALLGQQWLLDLHATVKTLHGRQEEARVGHHSMN
ncbi:MAG: hypothetical protein ACK555_08210 [Acidobacteriota bacterium]